MQNQSPDWVRSLDVQSRREVVWIDVETVRLLCPAFADVLEGCEPIEGLEALSVIKLQATVLASCSDSAAGRLETAGFARFGTVLREQATASVIISSR